jgi:hypothetical protein
MAICCYGLPVHCFQPAVAGGVICSDLWGELNTLLALQALFTQSSPVCEPLLQAFTFPSTMGEVTLHLLSHACVFVYSLRGKWVFPPLLWSFPPSDTLTSFPAPGCWVHAPTLTRASPASLACLFIVLGRISLPPLFCAQCAPPSLQRAFIVLIAYYSVSLISLGGGWSVLGAMLFWPRVVCGSTVIPLSSPCPHLPKPSGHGQLAAWGPF